MKILLFTFLIVGTVAGCSRESDDNSSLYDLKTETTELNLSSIGKVELTTTTRGDNEVLRIMTYSNKTVHTLSLRGQVKYIESDEDGDGHFESIVLPGDDMTDFEQYARSPEGIITPLDEGTYSSQKERIVTATRALEAEINRVKEK